MVHTISIINFKQ